MSVADLKSQLPDYAKDLRLNLESVLTEGGAPGLTQKQIAVIALASAIASRYKPLTAAINEEAAKHASAEELNGARVAAAIMGMNNIYYRFVHLVGDPEYGTLRANLRMNAMANPGGDKVDFELAVLKLFTARSAYERRRERQDRTELKTCGFSGLDSIQHAPSMVAPVR